MGANNDDVNEADPVQQQLDKAYDCEVVGKPDEALQLCAEIIQINPDLAEVYNLQGIVLEQLGRKQEAFQAYEKAVKLDLDFEEANENLVELKKEIEEKDNIEETEGFYGTDTFYVVKWGALAFGLAFGVLFWVSILLSISELELFLGLPFLQFLPAALLIGMATAVLGSVSNNKPIIYGFAGGIGYIAASWIGWGVFFQIILYFGYLFGFVQQINFSALVGICVGAIFGAILGIVSKDYRQIFWLAIAGTIGFGLYGMNFRIPLYSLDFDPVFNSSLANSLIFLIPDFIVDVIIGVIIGSLLGGVLGWFSGDEIVDEDDDELIEQTIPFN